MPINRTLTTLLALTAITATVPLVGMHTTQTTVEGKEAKAATQSRINKYLDENEYLEGFGAYVESIEHQEKEYAKRQEACEAWINHKMPAVADVTDPTTNVVFEKMKKDATFEAMVLKSLLQRIDDAFSQNSTASWQKTNNPIFSMVCIAAMYSSKFTYVLTTHAVKNIGLHFSANPKAAALALDMIVRSLVFTSAKKHPALASSPGPLNSIPDTYTSVEQRQATAIKCLPIIQSTMRIMAAFYETSPKKLKTDNEALAILQQTETWINDMLLLL